MEIKKFPEGVKYEPWPGDQIIVKTISGTDHVIEVTDVNDNGTFNGINEFGGNELNLDSSDVVGYKSLSKNNWYKGEKRTPLWDWQTHDIGGGKRRRTKKSKRSKRRKSIRRRR